VIFFADIARHIAWAGLIGICLLAAGCAGAANPAYAIYGNHGRLAPLGAISDSVWLDQEVSGEASKFVVYDHEFKLRSTRLNLGGEDHVKKIAARIQEGASFPVVVERTMNDKSEGRYKYPVGPNPELDNQRREVVVAALRLMGIQDADDRVLVAPALATSATGQEAESAYLRGMRPGRNSGAFGGGFGGFGGFGGGGMF
jgi:hypothetical protein